VDNLNADRVDGKEATEFLPTTGKAADADLLDGKDSTEFLAAAGKAADSDLFDGRDSTELIRAASASTTDAPDGNGDALSTSISAPTAGYVVVNASITLQEIGLLSDSAHCHIQVDDSKISGSGMGLVVPPLSLGICTTTAVATVDTGSRTIDLTLADVSSSKSWDASMSVLFIPFGADGTAPSS
jgi:hypothetical protein